MNFDLFYKEIGSLGRYQKYILSLSGFTWLYAGLLFISSFFTLGIPKHRCAIPGLINDSYEVRDEYHETLINLTIPPAKPNDKGVVYDKCHSYTADRYDITDIENDTTTTSNRTRVKCDRWVYDKSIFTSTLAAELNMVCDGAVLKANGQMMFFGGLLTGSLLTGMISDRFGRKITLCVSSIFYLTAALAIAWTPSFPVFMLLTFAVGFFSVGNFMSAFVLGMEFTGPSKRRFTGQLLGLSWTLGNMILAGLGFVIRDWMILQIVCAAPGILFMLYCIIFPESPRWLYSQGRLEESEKIIRRAAKVNKAQLSDKVIDGMFGGQEEAVPQGRLWHLFSSRTLAIRTIIIYFNWLVVCMVYYGLALNSGDLGGDLFLNFFLQTIMDIPGRLAVLLLVDRIGRKPIQVGSMVIGGIACLSTIFTIIFGGKDLQWLTTTLAMIGKIGASAGFGIVYQYSAELFPTVVRNAGMGSSSCLARVGGMIAPYVADLDRLVGGDFGQALPLIIFGSLSVVAGLFALYLPETIGRPLPESIEDGVKFGTMFSAPPKLEYICENSTKRRYSDNQYGKITTVNWDLASTNQTWYRGEEYMREKKDRFIVNKTFDADEGETKTKSEKPDNQVVENPIHL